MDQAVGYCTNELNIFIGPLGTTTTAPEHLRCLLHRQRSDDDGGGGVVGYAGVIG